MEETLPSGKGVGKPYVRNPKEQEVRAGMIMAQKLLGKSKEEIATLFNISTETVNRGLELARKKNLYGIAEQVMVERLMPKALAVFDQALDESDVSVARDVLFGTGVLQKTKSIAVGEGEITIDAIRAKIFATKRAPKEISDGQSQPVVEVSVQPIEEGPKTESKGACEGVVCSE